MVGSGTTQHYGPNGEDILVRDVGHTLQVIAIDEEGRSVNVMVERINRAEPSMPSALVHFTAEDLERWALQLLGVEDAP